jgi:hypothetical protein
VKCRVVEELSMYTIVVKDIPRWRAHWSVGESEQSKTGGGGHTYIHEGRKHWPAALHSRPDFDVMRSPDIK